MPEEEKADGVFVPIQWSTDVVDPGTRYATHLTVQNTEDEFIISFYEIKPPLALGTPDERRKQLEAVKQVNAECIARVIVSRGRMATFIEVLQNHYQQYEATTE